MLQAFRFGSSTTLTLSAVPNGTYNVYLYEVETWQPRKYSIKLQGHVVVPAFTTGTAGTWQKLGPWSATVVNGTLTVSTNGDVADLSGLEVWSTASQAPANVAPTFQP